MAKKSGHYAIMWNGRDHGAREMNQPQPYQRPVFIQGVAKTLRALRLLSPPQCAQLGWCGKLWNHTGLGLGPSLSLVIFVALA